MPSLASSTSNSAAATRSTIFKILNDENIEPLSSARVHTASSFDASAHPVARLPSMTCFLSSLESIAVGQDNGRQSPLSLPSSRSGTPSVSSFATSRSSPVSPFIRSDVTPSSWTAHASDPFRRYSPSTDGSSESSSHIFEGSARAAKSKFVIVAEIDDDVEPERSSLDGVWQQYASKIGADKFRCTYEQDCAFSGRKHSAKRHIETTHLAIKRWKCQVCSKCYTQKVSLERHHAKHTNSFPYPCMYREELGCTREFNDRSRRHKHMVDYHSHIPKPRARGKAVTA